jgi:bacterioferritin-associated ferredoxin
MALVCHCQRVNDRVLRTAALAAGGDLQATQAMCGAGTACGGCVELVEALVAAVRETSTAPAATAVAVA